MQGKVGSINACPDAGMGGGEAPGPAGPSMHASQLLRAHVPI